MTERERFINAIKKSLSGVLPAHMIGKVAERVAEGLVHGYPELLREQRKEDEGNEICKKAEQNLYNNGF